MMKKYNKKNLFDKILDDRKKIVNEIIIRMEKEGLNWTRDWTPEMVAPQNQIGRASCRERVSSPV